MPAPKKPAGKKKGTVCALPPQEQIDALTYAKCRELAERAIDLAYTELKNALSNAPDAGKLK